MPELVRVDESEMAYLVLSATCHTVGLAYVL